MNILITIVAFIIVFSILVLAHEFGHFIAAKRSGIKVEEFGIGFPPRIWARKKGETLYSINAILFGGFVRLLGMDSNKGADKNSKKSFSNRSMRTRAKVMVAGVFMNILLAWLLITIGFIFGMEPLLGQDDVLMAVDNGVIQLQENAVIKSIDKNGLAAGFDLREGDEILKINGKNLISFDQMKTFLASPVGKFDVYRNGKVMSFEITKKNLSQYLDLASMNNIEVDHTNLFGVELYDSFMFPRVKVYNVVPDSPMYKAGLRNDDVLVAVDGKQVYSVSDYLKLTEGLPQATLTVYRNGSHVDFLVPLMVGKRVIVSEPVVGYPAYTAGIRAKDIIVSVNGKTFQSASNLIDFIAENDGKKLMFNVKRDGKDLFFEITPKDGKTGMYLSELFSGSSTDVSIYDTDQFMSVLKIENEQYPFYTAPYYALTETYRMTAMTGELFVNFLGSFFGTGKVPDGVAGPVGIAQMTGTFAREGFIPLIRFIALLSISLGVLNILPFPALDGGKLLFIVIEFVVGRKVPAKWENYIHMLGYFLIMLLVVAVTYQDILRFITA